MDLYSAGSLGGGMGVVPVTFKNGRSGSVPVTVSIGLDGNPAPIGGKQETITLVSNSADQGAKSGYGGDYQARAFATNWAGGSAKLQFLDADGATYTDLANPDGSAVAAFTANRTQPLGLGSNAKIRAVVTGAPAGLYIVVSRQP
jgi:hypothetical protein